MRKNKKEDKHISTRVILASRKILSGQKCFYEGDDVCQSMMIYALIKSAQVFFREDSVFDITSDQVRFAYHNFIINPAKHILFSNIMTELKKNKSYMLSTNKTVLYNDVKVNQQTVYTYSYAFEEYRRVYAFASDWLQKLEQKRNISKGYSRERFCIDLLETTKKMTKHISKPKKLSVGKGISLEKLNNHLADNGVKSMFAKNTNMGLDVIAYFIQKEGDIKDDKYRSPEFLKNLYSTHIDNNLLISINDIYDTFSIIRRNGITTLNYAFTALHNIIVSKAAISLVENSELDDEEIAACTNYIKTQYGTKYKNRCCQDPYKLFSIALRMVNPK